VATLAGQGWLYGRAEYSLDPADPFHDGFIIDDIWA